MRMWPRKHVHVFAPLIQGTQTAHEFFFSVFVTANKKRCRHISNRRGQDPELSTLQDYGYYAAGVEAKKTYLRLMRHWRVQEQLPNWLLDSPPGWDIEISGKLADTMSFDCRSSQLALLLGMITTQQKFPFREIYATGELSNIDEFPKVEAVAGLKEKLDSILTHIAREKPLLPVLIALPRKIHPNRDSGPRNDSEQLFSRRISAFKQQHQDLNVTIIYCEQLLEDLELHFPEVGKYRHYNRKLKWLPLILLAAIGYWQFQKPLYINWDNHSFSEHFSDANHPLRLIRDDHKNWQIAPLCPQSKPGQAVFSSGDIMMMNFSIDDHSWLKQWTSPQVALVLAGAKSDIRIENLPSDNDSKYIYSSSYALQPPLEDYLVMAVAQRSMPIDKGTLNEKLISLAGETQGIERLTTIAGYLENHYDSVQYRFNLAAPNCDGEQ